MRKDELRLLPHDPVWAEDFLAEKNRIADALGDPSARIEHVGSTAIPTVHAKPILDIAILCGGKGIEPIVRLCSDWVMSIGGSLTTMSDITTRCSTGGIFAFAKRTFLPEPPRIGIPS